MEDHELYQLHATLSSVQGRLSFVEQLDDRLRDVEVQVAHMSGTVERNAEILDDIRTYINKPTNWPAWLGAVCGTAVLVGGLMYTAYIQPLEYRLEELEAIVKSRDELVEQYIRERRAASKGK